MTRPATYLCCLLAATALAGCDKAPRDVINERDMASLVADLSKAESYLQQNPGQFDTDSAKMALKQSVFAKHGVDQQLYDHSLEWYGHNMDVYTDMCDRAMRQLEDEKARLDQMAERGGDSAPATAPTQGDSADLWQGRRNWLLTGGARQGTLQWEAAADSRQMPGDRYRLALSVTGNAPAMTATLAADYEDGSTSTITRALPTAGRCALTLQTDTLRQLRRVYGYVRYDLRPGTFAMADSISLTRVRLDRDTYGNISAQTTVERRGDSRAGNIPDRHRLRDLQDEQARGRTEKSKTTHRHEQL